MPDLHDALANAYLADPRNRERIDSTVADFERLGVPPSKLAIISATDAGLDSTGAVLIAAG
jgi:hypothetical protein